MVRAAAAAAPGEATQIPVELGGVTRFVARSEITHVEAQGDYARLHTATASTCAGAAHDAGGAVGAGRVRAHPPLAAGRAAPT